MLGKRSEKTHHSTIVHDELTLYDRLQIETVEGCNLRCEHCISTKYGTPRLMKQEMFNSIVDQATDVGFTRFALSPTVGDQSLDSLTKERIEKLDSVGAKYHCFTNMTGAWWNIRRVVEGAGLDYLAVSVYGHDKESFKRNTGVDAFDTFMANMDRLAKLKAPGKSIHFVVSNPPKKFEFLTSIVGRMIADLSATTSFNVTMTESWPTENWAGRSGESVNNECAGPCVNALTKHKATIDGRIKACGCFDSLGLTNIGLLSDGLSNVYSRKNKRLALISSGRLFPSSCKKCSTYTPINEKGPACNYDKEAANEVYRCFS